MGKSSHAGCSWNEADSLDALGAFSSSQWVGPLILAAVGIKLTVLMPLAFLPWQLVGPVMLAAVGIKLTVLMPLWHSCLDSW